VSSDDARDHLTRWRELTGSLRDPFREAAEPVVQESTRAERNALSIEMVEDRAETIRSRLDIHMERHRPRWEAQELKRLRRANPDQVGLTRASGPKPPPGAITTQESRHDLLKERARMNVERRIEERRERIDTAERRMIHDLAHDRDRSRSR
jgi:exonuclease VII large subunit